MATSIRRSKTTRRVITNDGLELQIRGGQVVIEHYLRDGITRRTVNFSDHPYRDLVLRMLISDAPDLSGGAILRRVETALVFGEWLLSKHGPTPTCAPGPLTASVYAAFFVWLPTSPATPRQLRLKRHKPRDSDTEAPRRFSETTLAVHISLSATLYRSALEHGDPGYTERELALIQDAQEQELRGANQRAIQHSIEAATAGPEYSGLLRAVAIDLEACRARLAASLIGEDDAGIHPIGFGLFDRNPFAAFVVLATARHGVRAGELNRMEVDDLDKMTKSLAVHMSSKDPAEVAVDEAFIEAYRLCVVWSDEARKRSGKKGLLQFVSATVRKKGQGIRIDTDTINRRLLPEFYARYFAFEVMNDDGSKRPLLAHFGVTPPEPFWCDAAKLRHAAIRHFTNGEPNLELARQFARHARSATTQQYYLQQHRVELAGFVGDALKADAAIIRIGLRNAAVFNLSPVLEAIEARGGATPEGTCTHELTDLAQEPVSVALASEMSNTASGKPIRCQLAGDCLECDHFRLHSWKRPVLVAHRDACLGDAGKLVARGLERDAQNKLRRAALLEAHIQRIDEVVGLGQPMADGTVSTVA